jgi:DNA polymerase-4
MGHQHVLEPELRTNDGAANFARHLLTKAAERLRRGDYYCQRLGLHLSWTGDLGGWWDEVCFNETRDTGFLLGCLDQLCRGCRATSRSASASCCSISCPPASTNRIYSMPSTSDAKNCRR